MERGCEELARFMHAEYLRHFAAARPGEPPPPVWDCLSSWCRSSYRAVAAGLIAHGPVADTPITVEGKQA